MTPAHYRRERPTSNPAQAMNNEYLFGLGPKHLSRRVARIAKKHGATLVNHTDPGCKCGYGCRDNCPANRRHWFAGPNRGEPFDSQLARAVLSEAAQ